MADSSISSTSRDNERQLDEMKSAHEKKMSALRAQQQKEETELRESGDAVVNHIRKSADDRIASAREETDQKVSREDESLTKNYSSLKKRAAEQNTINEKAINASRERADSEIGQNKTREQQALAQSQEKLKDFLGKQRDLRAQTERKNGDELRESETHFNEAKRKQIADNSRELHSVQFETDEKIRNLKQNSQISFDETRAQAETRLAQLHKTESEKLKNEQERDNIDFNAVHQKSHDQVQREQQLGQARLSQTISENQRKMEEQRGRALTTNEKLEREYSAEANRVEQTGNADVNARTEKFNKLVLEQKMQQKEEVGELRADGEMQKNEVRKENETHIQETVAKLADELHRKQNSFKKQFASEDKMARESLHNQKEKFLKEEYKLHSAQNRQSELDEFRSTDVFYQPKSFDAALSEHDDRYEFTAKVPAYEKDNVEVRVKDDRVIISSARAYQNEAKDKEAGTRMETNTSQTYRQEFALAKPADSKRVITHVSDDGTITAMIPKKGFTKI